MGLDDAQEDAEQGADRFGLALQKTTQPLRQREQSDDEARIRTV
jgi:hypothetical protein